MAIRVVASEDPTNARLSYRDIEIRCCIGAGGTTDAKREGDQATPLGEWAVRRVFYRPDRIEKPRTKLDLVPIDSSMGWSDDPADSINYNRLVSLPYMFSHEVLRREDALYDIVVELGYNDDPAIPGLGSAIFMHVASPGFEPTAGCVALAIADLRTLLSRLGSDETILITRGPEV
ncbi:MAG: L,D-transpeptidase family protein [Alphaproteobacteria bacterium]|nr:L,D-transpeptidase family protein [Alphaproteobacteria bacterium]